MKEILFESQRLVATKNKEKIKVKSKLDIENLPQILDLKDKVQEHFIAIALDNKNFIKSIELIGIGSTSCIPMDTSDVLRCAILRGANKLILVHNHPSGDSTPSSQDIILTKRLNALSSYLNIKLLDHIIIGDINFSMFEKNMLEKQTDIEKLERDVLHELQKENICLKEKLEKYEKRETKTSIKSKIKSAEERAEKNSNEKDVYKNKQLEL